MEARALTPMQQELLRMFSFEHSDNFVKEIKSVLNSYFQRKIEDETERLWDSGILDQKALDQLRKEDLHKL